MVLRLEGGKANAMTPELLETLERMIDGFERGPAAAAVLTGHERNFSAGLALTHIIDYDLVELRGFIELFSRAMTRVFACPKPIVAAVNGHCVAGGMEMLLGTDLRVAVPEATFGVSEVRWGFVAAGGSHVRLPRQVPWAIAMELLLTGDAIDAATAARWGLVNKVVALEELLPAALDYARRIAANAPLAVQACKELAIRAPELGLSAGLRMEQYVNKVLLGSHDAKEGAQAFAEKRSARFNGT